MTNLGSVTFKLSLLFLLKPLVKSDPRNSLLSWQPNVLCPAKIDDLFLLSSYFYNNF